MARERHCIRDGQTTPAHQQYQRPHALATVPAIGATAIFILFGRGNHTLELPLGKVIGRQRPRDNRLFEMVGGIDVEPAVGHAKREKGAQSLVPASRSIGSDVPGVAKFPQLRQPELFEIAQPVLLAPAEKSALDKSPLLPEGCGLQFAGFFIVEVGGDRTLDRDGLVRPPLQISRPSLGFGPTAGAGAAAN